MNATELLDRLEGVRGRFPSWQACCPAHEDRTPSLHITDKDGVLLVYCHGGCATADVLAAVGLSLADICDAPDWREERAKRERKYRGKDVQYAKTLLMVCDEDRKAGKKLSAETLEHERNAWLLVNGAQSC